MAFEIFHHDVCIVRLSVPIHSSHSRERAYLPDDNKPGMLAVVLLFVCGRTIKLHPYRLFWVMNLSLARRNATPTNIRDIIAWHTTRWQLGLQCQTGE